MHQYSCIYRTDSPLKTYALRLWLRDPLFIYLNILGGFTALSLYFK
ncbi:hypothetical protein QWZ13_11835 [Reinekea marina]|nr:hypothetical protein [Reinekea marina]MDN3649607.1 hypothetical protein [Reinekea marina]